eukprot:7376721-Karenia_brevis.AAC.1
MTYEFKNAGVTAQCDGCDGLKIYTRCSTPNLESSIHGAQQGSCDHVVIQTLGPSTTHVPHESHDAVKQTPGRVLEALEKQIEKVEQELHECTSSQSRSKLIRAIVTLRQSM